MTPRGVYQSKRRAKQLLLFDGLKWGNITPTDVDMVIEFKNATWVLCEVKFNGRTVGLGQRLLMERFVEDMSRAGKTAIAIVSDHYIEDCETDVDVKQTTVREFYSTTDPIWKRTKNPTTL